MLKTDASSEQHQVVMATCFMFHESLWCDADLQKPPHFISFLIYPCIFKLFSKEKPQDRNEEQADHPASLHHLLHVGFPVESDTVPVSDPHR